jgi:hypothetical protein
MISPQLINALHELLLLALLALLALLGMLRIAFSYMSSTQFIVAAVLGLLLGLLLGALWLFVGLVVRGAFATDYCIEISEQYQRCGARVRLMLLSSREISERKRRRERDLSL